jgi:hypothetical protein
MDEYQVLITRQKYSIQYYHANKELDSCVDVNFHLLFDGIRGQY